MIRGDHYHIVNPVTGAMVFAIGTRWCAADIDTPRLYSEATAAAALADPPVRWRGDPAEMRRAPQCGCCGRLTRDRARPALAKPVLCVGPDEYRCDRHVDRIPCCIEGCGRTFAIGHGGYREIVICGAHWRQAPRSMRDAVARVRRQARRRGWSPTMKARFERLWLRTVRSVREGHRIDMTEINALFGWAI